jgi:hypothetical protein
VHIYVGAATYELDQLLGQLRGRLELVDVSRAYDDHRRGGRRGVAALEPARALAGRLGIDGSTRSSIDPASRPAAALRE